MDALAGNFAASSARRSAAASSVSSCIGMYACRLCGRCEQMSAVECGVLTGLQVVHAGPNHEWASICKRKAGGSVFVYVRAKVFSEI